MNITDELDYLEGIMSDEYLLYECTGCNERFPPASLTRTHDDSFVCKDCLDTFYDTCIHCESIIDLADVSIDGKCPVCGNEA